MSELVSGVNLFVSQWQDVAVGEELRTIHACALKARVAIPVALTIPVTVDQENQLSHTQCELMITAASGYHLEDISSRVRIVL